MSSVQKEIYNCLLSGDLESIQKNLTSDKQSLFEQCDEIGRNIVFTASMLGRSAIIRELICQGAQVNEKTARGYTPLHCAACWGHLDTVETLVELGADITAKNFREQKAVDLATKYSKTDCADFLTVTEARQDLMSYINYVNTFVNDQKLKGQTAMKQKKICKDACTAVLEWIGNVKDPTASDILKQKSEVEETLQPVLANISGPDENTGNALVLLLKRCNRENKSPSS